ncbi:MAG: VWA domain-containing protein [Acidimicrobiia bacterium]|nr:VWA domain-containing protein [Acidimicrobiia bacterium]
MARVLRSIALGALFAVLTTFGSSAQQSKPAQPTPGGQGQAGQPGTQQPSGGTPVFRGGIDIVRVDVIVTDKAGNAVTDLKQSDFEIVEDGQMQTIDSFRLIELNGGLMPGPDGPPRPIRSDLDEETEAARDDVRLFGIFLDDYHVRQGTSMSARQQISRFIETQLGPSDMVGLMYPLQPVSTIRFSRNHEVTSKAVQQFLGRKYDYTPRNTIEEQYAYYPTEVVERIRNQVSLSAIEGMIVHMGTLKEGRKALLLVSEGYSNMVPPQMRDQMAAIRGSGNTAVNDPFAGQNDPNESRASFMASTDLQNDLRQVFAAANRHNVAIYAIDPRGLATNEFDINENIGGALDREYLSSTMNTLRQLAEESDGRAIVNRNDLVLGMRQIMKDSSAYYLLGYTSTIRATDGKFHEIKVRVKRPGVQVRARKGYWALTSADVKIATAPPKPELPKAVESALSSITAGPKSSRVVRTWIGTERGENGKTRVTFVWEPMPKTPGERARPGDSPARVALTALGENGGPVYRGRVPEGSPASGAAAPAGSRVSFEVPPGKIQLRIAVEGTEADTLDSEIRELSIPDLTTPETKFGTPQVFRARNVREAQQARNDPNAVPTGLREFSRTDRVLVKVAAYGPGTVPPTMTARVLNRTGAPMNDLAVTPAAPSVGVIDMPLAGFAVGEYVIEITASGPGGDAKELIGFRVTG